MKTVAKQLMVIAGLLLSSAAWGQKISPKEMAENMKSALSKGESVEFTFSFMSKDPAGKTIAEEEGTFIAQGDCFRMNTDALEIFCDGKAKWLYDKTNEEITIFPHDPSTIEIAESPFAVLGMIDAEKFIFRPGAKSVEYSGRKLQSFTIVPKDKNVSYSEVTVSLDPDSWYPVLLEYKSIGGDRYILDISGIVMGKARNDSFYVPSPDLMDNPDIYVSDMR